MRTFAKLLFVSAGAAAGLVTLAACTASRAPLDLEQLLGAEITSGVAQAPTEPVPTRRAPPVTPTPETDENCVACHANQELLQALATEAEETESLSSGEG